MALDVVSKLENWIKNGKIFKDLLGDVENGMEGRRKKTATIGVDIIPRSFLT